VNDNENKIKLGVSACLLGQPVRYDGGHKRDRYVTDTLASYVDYVPVCPEVECGLPVPRESMRLTGDPANPRLVTRKTGLDHTDRMLDWGEKRLRELEKEPLCGYIFKSKSPSSGMARVKVYGDGGRPLNSGVGLWARMFMAHFPLLPFEEEGRLNDGVLRENFIQRIFVCKRWRDLEARGRTLGNLVEFHTRHKLLVLAHSTVKYRELGKLVAQGKQLSLDELFQRYQELLAGTLKFAATRKKHVNVLQHVMGYFKRDLSSDEKQELLEVINRYAAEQVPLIVPVTLLNHYVRKYDQPYLKEQYYLEPHPSELALRNHV
jgi:uncharacterized protein YbgA (DUF1722 family)/uncharacterized protein YbbK (DUF523 family)